MICSASVGISVRARLRSRVGLASLVLLLAPGCSLSNPGFYESSAGESAGTSTTTQTTTSPDTSSTSSSGTGATGGESEGSSTGALTLTEGSSTGNGTTSEATTAASSTTGTSTSTSTGADSEGSTSDGGEPEPMTLHNYSSLEKCDKGLWCAENNNPVPVQHATLECFSSPIDPPFEISKLTVYPRKILGNPEVWIRVFYPDGQMYNIVMEKYVGAVGPGLAAKDLIFDPPFLVNQSEFCVGYQTSPGNTQLAASVDREASISGVSIVRMFGTQGCIFDPTPLTKIYPGAENPRFCMDVEIIPQ